MRGDIFSLGSMPWQILGISKNRLMVEPAPGMAPSLPFWQTEAAGRSPAMSARSTLRRDLAASYAPGASATADGDRAKAAARWLVANARWMRPPRRRRSPTIRRGVAALGVVPDERTLVVERFFDGLGGTQIVIHSPFGIRLNRGLGLAIRKRLCQILRFRNSGLGDRRRRAARAQFAPQLSARRRARDGQLAHRARHAGAGDARRADVRSALPPRRHARARGNALDRAAAKSRPGFSACARRN